MNTYTTEDKNGRYEVRYMNGGEGELLMDNASYIEAQAHVAECWDEMDPERAADVVIRLLPLIPDETYEDILSNTTEATTEVSTTIQQEVISMENVNKSAVLSTMASELFHSGLNPRVALIAATAWVGAIDYYEDQETFFEAFMDGLNITSVEIRDCEEMPMDEINGGEILAALTDAGYLTVEGYGTRFEEILALRTEAYRPAKAEDGIERRFGYAPTKYSNLFKEAVHALESSEYTVDEHMLMIARQVIAKTGGADADKESYVIRGCEMMDPNEAYVSEFKGDRRLRLYQASCHGPNGQSSDRSRALMNLAGVPTDYDVDTVLPVLRAEMADMVTVSDPKDRGALVKAAMADPVEFIIHHTQLKADESQPTIVTKPYSFVKAATILVQLHKGERPYLGMASGLDAKCSGPQLGALMVGDQMLAAACGFSLEKVHDAYHRAIVECEKAGFYGLDRDGIKKPFMGIFYGQGWAAFMDPEAVSLSVWNAIHGEGEYLPSEDKAKAFHKAVCASFGAKMMGVRNAIKAYAEQIDKKITHYMPDGSLVAMNYKQKVNILEEAVDFDTPLYDVFLNNNAESYKFINFQLNTAQVHYGDFARNGFVNMIQATDALLARLIIVHLKRMGAKHIICVHDCFRVNMTEMHLLEAAIKAAYTDLFGGEKNERTKDLPMGKDILGLYFEGANKALREGEDGRMVSQFFGSGKRRMFKVGGVSLMSLIKQLGTTYYFAK